MEGLETISLDDEHAEWVTRIGMQASLLVRKGLILFLWDNLDIFVWTYEDMLGIDLNTIVHQLNISPSFPLVWQSKRVFTQESDKATTEEVHKLLGAGFIREVYYHEWLANEVMVKKVNGKWRMCVDFIDLNKACPKDSYPFPRIDLFVDLTAGHQLLSFMDAFSGYN